MISAVAVVIPARNEQQLIGHSLRGLRVALRALPAGVEHSVCVVLDRCTDDTPAVVDTARRGWPALLVLRNDAELTIGELRDLGMRQARAALAGHSPARLWLLSTDADTVVATDWAYWHWRIAATGAHAVAGTAQLALPAGPTTAKAAAVMARYAAVIDRARVPEGHGNVYAANLGVRADAYLAVGGFGPVATGEDHHLWHRLGHAGYRRHYADGPSVRTSARRHGRAPGGLASLLSSLETPGAVRHG